MINLPSSPRLLSRVVEALVILFTLELAAAAQDKPPAPLPGQPETPVAKSTVKGRIVYEDTTRPLRRAPVTLFQLTNGPDLTSATDREGKFVIKDVPAGIYFAVVNSPGIITPYAYMNITDKDQPESIDRKAVKEYCTEIVVDGTSDVEVTVHARRGGVISGKVTYQDGGLALNAEVNVLRRFGKQASRVFTGLNTASMLSLHTDDRGMYRIPGLPPGEYLVSAAENNTTPGKRGRSRAGGFDEFFQSDALTAAYYGGGTRLRDALTVKVEAGAETKDIDITLPDVALHTLTGSVVSHLDQVALPGAAITIRNEEQFDWFLQTSQKVQSDSQGQWTLEGIPDGTYSIVVEPPYDTRSFETPDGNLQEEGRRRGPRKLVPKETEITVAGADLAVGAIELAEGASISGTVSIPNAPAEAFAVIHCSYEEAGGSESQRSAGAFNGTFIIDSLRAGKVYLTASTTMRGNEGPEAKQFYVKSITLNGKDLTKTPLTIAEGQSIKNVQVVIVADVAHARVLLLDAQGKPVGGKPIMVVPVDSQTSRFASDGVLGTTDVNGILPIAGAPGDYLVFITGPEDPWPPTKEWVTGRAETAQRIKLELGTTKVITVTINP
jgi:Carboxypeptidase regulatory-like domain